MFRVSEIVIEGTYGIRIAYGSQKSFIIKICQLCQNI